MEMNWHNHDLEICSAKRSKSVLKDGEYKVRENKLDPENR